MLILGILRAFRTPALCGLGAAGHLDPFPVDERIGNFSPSLVEIAPSGLAGDAQFFCRLFLFETFEIDEPDQLDLIGLKRDPLVLRLRTAAGLVTTGLRGTGNSAPEPGPSTS